MSVAGNLTTKGFSIFINNPGINKCANVSVMLGVTDDTEEDCSNHPKKKSISLVARTTEM